MSLLPSGKASRCNHFGLYSPCLQSPEVPCSLDSTRRPTPAKTTPAKTAADEYKRGLKALQENDLATARSAFAQAVKLSPDNAEYHNALAQVMLRQGDT